MRQNKQLGKKITASGGLSSVLRLLLWCWVVSTFNFSPSGPTRTGMAISYWPRLDKKAAREGGNQKSQFNLIKSEFALIYNNNLSYLVGKNWSTDLLASYSHGPSTPSTPSFMRPKGCCHDYPETVYFLSVPVCARAWWRFIVQTHTTPNRHRQLTNRERSPVFIKPWAWRSSPFPHRVNTQRSEFPGTGLEKSVLRKTTV